MIAREASPMPLVSVGTHDTVTPEPAALEFRFAPSDVEAEADPTDAELVPLDLAWDPLLIAVAGYLLMAVGRLHQLFPFLDLVRPATLTGLAAIGLYATNREAARRFSDVW